MGILVRKNSRFASGIVCSSRQHVKTSTAIALQQQGIVEPVAESPRVRSIIRTSAHERLVHHGSVRMRYMTIADMLWHQCCISLLRVFVRTYKRDRRHISEVCHTIGLAVWVIAVNGSAVLTRLQRRSDTLRCHGGDLRCASGLRERQDCSESFRRSHRQC